MNPQAAAFLWGAAMGLGLSAFIFHQHLRSMGRHISRLASQASSAKVAWDPCERLPPLADSHFIEVRVRRDGKDYRLTADWLKHVAKALDVDCEAVRPTSRPLSVVK